MDYKIHFKNDSYGIDTGLGFKNEPSTKDIFELLVADGHLSKDDVLNNYDRSEEDTKFAIEAFKNGVFDEPETDTDWGKIFSKITGDLWEGAGNLLIGDSVTKSRLGDFAKSLSDGKEPIEGQEFPWSNFGPVSPGPMPTYSPPELDPDTQGKVDKSASAFMKMAKTQLWSTSVGDQPGAMRELEFSMQKAGLDINDKSLKSAVANRAIALNNLQNKATNYQAVANVVGGYRMLGSWGRKTAGQLESTLQFSDKTDNDIMEELRHLRVMRDTSQKLSPEKGPVTGAQVVQEVKEFFMPDKIARDVGTAIADEKKLRKALKDGLITADQAQAMMLEVVADPANIFTGAGAKVTQMGMRNIVQGQIDNLANQMQTASQAHMRAYQDLQELYNSRAQSVLGEETFKAIEKPMQDVLDQSRKAMEDASTKWLDATSDYTKAPYIQKGLGYGIEKGGALADNIGRTIEWIQKIPKEMATDFLMKRGLSLEDANRLRNYVLGLGALGVGGAVMGSDIEWDPNWTWALYGLGAVAGGKALQVGGVQARHIGKHMQGANGSRNFFEYYQQLDTQPLFSGAVVDRTLDVPVSAYEQGKKIFNKGDDVDTFSRLGARGMTKTGADKVASFALRTGSNLVENTALPTTLGYLLGGEEGAVSNFSASVPFFTIGMVGGEVSSHTSQASVKMKQRGDITNHRKGLSEEQGQLYDSLNFPAQVAIANAQTKFPNARFVIIADKNQGNGSHRMEDGQSVITINALGDAPMQGIVAHEVGHHMTRHGFTPLFNDIFFGSVAKEKAGIFTAKDKDGNPIIEYKNGVASYKTNEQFNQLRKQYTDRLANMRDAEHIRRGYENPNMIMEEIVAEQVAHMMLNPDKPGGLMSQPVGQLAKSLFSAISGKGFTRDMAMGMGGAVDQFGNGIFDFNDNPELKAIIREFEKKSARSSRQEMNDMIEEDAYDDVKVSPTELKDNQGLQNLFNNRLIRNDDGSIQYGIDGLPKMMTKAQMDKVGKDLSQDLSDAIESRGDNLPAGHVRMREGEDGKTIGEGLFLDDSIIDELARNPKYSASQINFLRQASAVGRAMGGGDFGGNEVIMFYYPATRGQGKKYKSLQGGFRTELLYGIRITKADNVTLETLSISGIEANLNKAFKSKRRFELFQSQFVGSTLGQVKENFYQDLKRYLANQQKGIENGSSESGISPEKRDLINSIMGVNTPRQRETNPMHGNMPKLQTTIRSRRVDRLGSIEQTGRGGYVDYVKIRENLMPRGDSQGQMVMDIDDLGSLLDQNPNINLKSEFKPSQKSIHRALGIPANPTIKDMAKALVDYDFPEYIEGTAEANHKMLGVDMRELIDAMHEAYNDRFYGRMMPRLDEPNPELQNLSLDELNDKLTGLERQWRNYGSIEEPIKVINDDSSFSHSRNKLAHQIQQVKLAMADKQGAYINKAGTLKEIPQATIDKAVQEGYDPTPVYHGTPNREIQGNVFEPGRAGMTYFAEERSFSEGFGRNIDPYFLKGKMFDFEGNPEHRKKAIKMFNDGGGWRSLWETSGYDPDNPIGGQEPYNDAHPLIDTLPESERELVDWLRTRSDKENPYNWDEKNDIAWELFDNPENDVLSELMGEGYDTFRFIDGDGKTIARATSEPSNIKRIESDVPMDQRFDPSNPDIRYMPTISGKQNPDIVQETSINTKLWDQTKTENFKNWFGKSKLVDDEGVPKLMFHGSPTSGFSTFDPKKSGTNGDRFGAGYYFTDDVTLADDYSDTHWPRIRPGVYPAFIKLEKPLVLEGVDGMKQTSINKQQAYDLIKSSPNIMDPNGPISNWIDTGGKPPTDAQLRKISEDYDGSSFMVVEGDFYEGQTEAFLENVREVMDADGLLIKGMDGLPDVAVSWDNRNIKSAIGNRGTFDPDSADVRHLPRFTYVKAEKTGSSPSQEPNPFDLRFAINEFNPGGYFFDADTGENINGKTFSSMNISTREGRPSAKVGDDQVEQIPGSPRERGPAVKVNMIDGRPGRYGNKFKWEPYPYQIREGMTADALKEKWPWLVSIDSAGINKKHRRGYPGKPTDHAFALEVENMVPTTMATYPKGSNPRGRPTSYGNVVLGRPVGQIDMSGRKHWVYDKVTILPKKGMPGFSDLEQIASNMKVVPHRKGQEFLVRIDVEKFNEIYSQDDSYVGPGGKGGIGNRYDEVKLFLSQGGGMELGQGSLWAPEGYVNKDGSAGFQDGRHRFQVLRGMGMTSMPVAMSKNSIANAKKFGLLTKGSNGDFDFRHMPRLKSNHPEALPVVQKLDDKGRPKMKAVKKDGKPTGKFVPDYETIDYDIKNSPLVQKHLGEKKYDREVPWDQINVTGLSGPEKQKLQEIYETGFLDEAVERMSNDYIEWMKDPSVRAGKGWYSNMRVALRDVLGDRTEFFAQLLGATSANTAVEDNFIQSVEAMTLFDQGKYNKLIERYLEAYDLLKDSPEKLYDKAIENGVIKPSKVKLKDGSYSQNQNLPTEVLASWIKHYKLVPRKMNGKRFNKNSSAVMRVLAGSWLDLAGAPKTPNFTGNLTGRTLEATIDVWAVRYLRRMAFQGEDVWRIQPKSETGVTDIDFALGQMVFRATAEKLGINPDDLQAIAWFGEKGVWDQGGWTDGSGAYKSSFEEPFDVFFGDKDLGMRNFKESLDIIDYFRANRMVQEGKDRVADPGRFDTTPEKAVKYLDTKTKLRDARRSNPKVEKFLTSRGK